MSRRGAAVRGAQAVSRDAVVVTDRTPAVQLAPAVAPAVVPPVPSALAVVRPVRVLPAPIPLVPAVGVAPAVPADALTQRCHRTRVLLTICYMSEHVFIICCSQEFTHEFASNLAVCPEFLTL